MPPAEGPLFPGDISKGHHPHVTEIAGDFNLLPSTTLPQGATLPSPAAIGATVRATWPSRS